HLPTIPSFPTRRSSDLAALHVYRGGNSVSAAQVLPEVIEQISLVGKVPQMMVCVDDWHTRVDRVLGMQGEPFRARNEVALGPTQDRKSTRLNSSHVAIS